MEDLVEACAKDLLVDGDTFPGPTYYHITQTFGYLLANHLRYGVISTYDNTWFLFRPPNNPGELQISSSFQSNSQQPTLFQGFCHLLSLVDKEHMCNSAPPSPPVLLLSSNEDEDPSDNGRRPV